MFVGIVTGGKYKFVKLLEDVRTKKGRRENLWKTRSSSQRGSESG